MSCWHRRYGSWLRFFGEPSKHRLAWLARPRHTFQTIVPESSQLWSRNRVHWHYHSKTWLFGRAHRGLGTTTLHPSYLLHASAYCTRISKFLLNQVIRSMDWWRSRRHRSSDCVDVSPRHVRTRSVLLHPGKKDDIPSGHRTCPRTLGARWGQSNSLCLHHLSRHALPRTSMLELHSCDRLGNCKHYLHHISSYLAPKLSR